MDEEIKVEYEKVAEDIWLLNHAAMLFGIDLDLEAFPNVALAYGMEAKE